MQKATLIGEYITTFTITAKRSWNKHNKEVKVKDLCNNNFLMLVR